MTRLYPWHKLPQFWELAQGMETGWPWNWRSSVLKTIKMTLIRPPMTNFKMTVRANCTFSACSPLPWPIKAPAHWLSVGGVWSWPLDICLSTPYHPSGWLASKIKWTFLSTNLASLMAFDRQAARPHFRLQYEFVETKQAGQTWGKL